MKILITGSRFWTNRKSISNALRAVINEHSLKREDLVIIHGKCRGADMLADSIARTNGIKVVDYPANWKDGKQAGPIRNQEMLDKNPDIDLVLAFHDDLDQSKGTKDMIQRARKAGIRIKIYDS